MKKKDKIYWYFAVILWLTILLTSCKSTKSSCDAYGFIEEKRPRELLIITNDTLHLAEEHIHLDEEQACEWSPSYLYIIQDTFRIRY
jgi:hypothetical protein